MIIKLSNKEKYSILVENRNAILRGNVKGKDPRLDRILDLYYNTPIATLKIKKGAKIPRELGVFKYCFENLNKQRKEWYLDEEVINILDLLAIEIIKDKKVYEDYFGIKIEI